MKAFQREGVAAHLCGAWRRTRLRGLYAEKSGTCLGVPYEMQVSLKERVDLRSLVWYQKSSVKGYRHKMRRRPALAADEMDTYVSNRVVPPSLWSLCRG